MPLKNGPSTRRRLVPAALTALALPLAAGAAGIGATPAGAASMGDMAGMPGMSMTAHAAAPTRTAAAKTTGAAPRSGAARTMFRVGSPTHPLMENGPDGPLWSATPPSIPGRAAHGTFGAIYVAAQLAQAAEERVAAQGLAASHAIHATASTAATTGAVLTTAQATKQLSKSCQKLIKAKPSKLSKADRKKRTKCIAQRDALVAASKKPSSPAPTPTPSPVPAPAAPIQGPSPVTSTTPQATPTPTPAASGGIDPSTVVCSAVGVAAIDIQPFSLTRGVACTSDSGGVTFQLTNRDSQAHGIAIKAAGADDSTGKVIIATLAQHSGPVSQKVQLDPGNYTIFCTYPSHNITTATQTSMEVDIKILTKADYIAQGYAG